MYDVRVYNLQSEGNIKITNHFKVREFACMDGCPIVCISLDLVDALEDIRTIAKCSIIVNSGYRTYSHNKKVGGAPNSMHIYGLAADIRPGDGNVKRLYDICATYLKGEHGLGKYNSFVHIDMRKNTARW